MDGCRTETPMSSSRGDSAELAQQELQMIEPMSTEWTDEKHSLYLKSMEASFVNQLYNSIDLLDLQLKKEMSNPNLSQHVRSNTCTPSGQFKVLRSGCWQKVNFQRPNLQVNVANEPHDILISPWIQHFRSVRKPKAAVQEKAALHNRATNSSRKKVVPGGTETGSKHSYACCCYSCHVPIDNNTEVSDQNFVDENIKSNKISNICSSKRMKTQNTDASINDQVVPYGKVAGNNAAARRDDTHI